MCRGPVYAAVGMAQESVFPLDPDPPGLQRKAWAMSYDSLPSSAALDDGLDPERHPLDRYTVSYSGAMRRTATQHGALLSACDLYGASWAVLMFHRFVLLWSGFVHDVPVIARRAWPCAFCP
jgi:hypothetical protein